jgi:membrane associated rhomboid family serine protease
MISIIIIILTVAVSVIAFSNATLFDRLKFNAFFIKNSNEWYRSLTYGLIHADWMHLIINMYVLYSFGSVVEYFFGFMFVEKANFYFVLMYVSALAVSVLPDLRKHRDNPYYNAVGASGAVSAIVFASILFYPVGEIYLFFIPIGIPAFIFGGIYLGYSIYMAKRQRDNIGHMAHFTGAVFGFLFPILFKPDLVYLFVNQIVGYF